MYVNSSLTAQRITFFTGLRFFGLETALTNPWLYKKIQSGNLCSAGSFQVRKLELYPGHGTICCELFPRRSRDQETLGYLSSRSYSLLRTRCASLQSSKSDFAQHSRVYTFQGGGIHRGGDNLNKACKCSTGISPLPEFPQP